MERDALIPTYVRYFFCYNSMQIMHLNLMEKAVKLQL